jgi:hypothetical protein
MYRFKSVKAPWSSGARRCAAKSKTTGLSGARVLAGQKDKNECRRGRPPGPGPAPEAVRHKIAHREVQLRDAGEKLLQRYALSPFSTTARSPRGGSSRFSIAFGTTCQNRSGSSAQSLWRRGRSGSVSRGTGRPGLMRRPCHRRSCRRWGPGSRWCRRSYTRSRWSRNLRPPPRRRSC